MENNNNNNSISADLSKREEKDKLLDEILLLEAHVSLLETMIVTPKFGQLEFDKLPLIYDNEAARFHITDVQTELCYELYRFVGLRCREFDRNSRLVFEINNTVTKNDPYAIEILIDENGRGKLGKWVLPMSTNVQEILSQYPIDNLNNVKHFLKSCKHHVDSYLCRLKQFEELQDLLSGIKNIRVTRTLGITLIEFVISEIKDIDSDKFYNVILYLYYESAAARPYKLSSDTDDNEKPSPILIKKLNKYFKPFLMENLSLAFLQISESQTKFVWPKIIANDNEDIARVFEKSDDGNIGFLAEFLHRGDKKRQKKSKNKVQNKKITFRENETKTSVEKEKSKDINVTARDDFSRTEERIKSRKRKQSTKTIAKPNGPKKSQADLKKLRNGMSSTEKNSDRNIADISNVANGVRFNVRQKKSNNEICEANIEHVQMEDNYNRKKDFLQKSIDESKENHKKLPNESNNTNSEHSMNSQKVKKKRRTITRIDQTEKKNISKLKNNKRAKISSSTPNSKRLPNKSYVFHEMSSITQEK
ncbi:putative histone-lysine N-methyltransferase 1 [Polyergus mexicanus]|uniref:putative histone-lysine N-methyltransferase 1 n=1 Tax=Polyergus mexicanus TaxID=615972 RepID=UPI0038B63FB4